METKKHTWSDFDKFSKISKPYLPMKGEGETIATQLSTAWNKLVYKWFNDGDVYDNTYQLVGWCNDLSSYANWIHAHFPKLATILDRISVCFNDDDYTDLLYDLSEEVAKMDFETLDCMCSDGSVYECDSPFTFNEDEEDDEEEW